MKPLTLVKAITLWTLLVLGVAGCRLGPPNSAKGVDTAPVAFVVYDAGETLGLLPVAARLRSDDIKVDWFPLTPWAVDLLEANGESFFALPAGISDMPHLASREAESVTGYWEEALIREPHSVVISGMVSAAQGQIAMGLRWAGVSTRGFYDGFQSPAPGSIGAETAPAFDEIWVPTTRVQNGFGALGFEVVVAGQPTLGAWWRASREVDSQEVRRLQGVEETDRILIYAGQYGPGYAETLASFLEAIRGALASDPSLLLVLSHHPRTDGAVERAALERAAFPRAVMAVEGLPTMELATISEAVLTWTSTVGVQAAFMGKPVVYFSPPGDFDTHLGEQGLALLADEASLGPLLTGVLQNPQRPEAIQRSLAEAGFVVGADSVVAEMILEAIR